MQRILIIDDDEQVRTLLRDILTFEGFSVIEAGDGAVGLKLYREQPTDLIMTDLIMPEKEGLETIMALRKEFPNVRIIAMSAGGSRGHSYLPTAKMLGAAQTLSKPFLRQEAVDAVRKTLAAC